MRFIRACVWVILAWLAVVFATMVLGCLPALPYIAPKPRSIAEQKRTDVIVLYSCSQADPWHSTKPYAAYTQPDVYTWMGRQGHGVVLDEYNVLTANHVVPPCPFDIPSITVTTRWGRSHRVSVTRRWEDLDLARLSIMIEPLKVHTAPPAIGELPRRKIDKPDRKGLSGRGMYNDLGELIGIHTGGTDDGMTYAMPVRPVRGVIAP